MTCKSSCTFSVHWLQTGRVCLEMEIGSGQIPALGKDEQSHCNTTAATREVLPGQLTRFLLKLDFDQGKNSDSDENQ